MLSSGFWKAAFERAVKTAAQSALAVVVVGDQILNAFDTDWTNVGGVALGGAVVSILTSLASGAVTDGSPSLNNSEHI